MKKTMLAVSAAIAVLAPVSANAQDAYLGEIRWFAFNYCPTSWVSPAGQSLLVSQYNALFALLGTTYGGNGVQNFNLPDLRGRVPVGAGAGTGLLNYTMGQTGGSEYVAVAYNQLPANVATGASTQAAVSKAPAGADPTTTVNVPTTTSVTGSNQPHENRQPFLTMQPCINTQGIWPTRP
ncbi:MAG: hypothetical protein RLZZ08_835 [Pseudomonadota bacterium]|jgi:microcystin-dependent protein